MEFTAEAIAEFLKGTIEGDSSVAVTNVSKIEEGKPGTLSFLANPKYTKYIYTTEASIVLINKNLELEQDVKPTLIRVEDAYKAFASLLQLYEQYKPKKAGVDKNVSIAASAKVGDNPYIGDFAYIGENTVVGNNVKIYPNCYVGDNCVIGDNTTLYAGVKIYSECKVGNNCILHAGAVVGSDGFGFAPQDGGDYEKIPQIGNVILEDNVEIGANTTIDRATMGSTILHKGVKIDNLVQVAHNVEIGDNTAIAAQAGISGSSKIGKHCILAGQVGIVGHISIADKVIVAAQAGVSNTITQEKAVLLGSPAAPISETRKSMVIYKKLPELREKVLQLEKELAELKGKL